MNFYIYSKGMIVTKRIQQLVGASFFVGMAALAIRAFDQACVFQTIETIFLTAFILTYLREERRAILEPYSKAMKRWSRFEDLLFIAAVGSYFMYAYIHHYSFRMFYGYFNIGGIGMYLGMILGEWLWHNSRLKLLENADQERYWKNYKDNLMG